MSFVVVDHTGELDRLDAAAGEAGVVQDVLIRAIPGVDSDTHPSIATGHAGSTFGMPPAEAVRAAERIAELPALRFAGVHAHLGSQLLEVRPYLEEVDVLLDLLAAIRDATGAAGGILDVGGGFGVRTPVSVRSTSTGLPAACSSAYGRAPPHGACVAPIVAVEPGRSLVANTTVTLYRVGAVKDVEGRRSAAVDGGMSDNPRPSLYGARYELAAAGPPRAAAEPGSVDASSGGTANPATSSPTGSRCRPICAAATCWRRRRRARTRTRWPAPTTGRVALPSSVCAPAPSHRGSAARTRPTSTGWRRRRTGCEPAPPIPEGVTIRPATPRDAGAFLAFWSAIVAERRYVRSETVRHSARVYRARFRHAWTDREAQVLAVDGDRVVGHLYVQREEHPATRHVATLGIAVAASHRRLGIGAALMSECLRWAREAGVEKILLSVYPHNTGAIALYRSFGFVEEGRLARQSRKSYGDEDEILMATWLGESGERT